MPTESLIQNLLPRALFFDERRSIKSAIMKPMAEQKLYTAYIPARITEEPRLMLMTESRLMETMLAAKASQVP